MAAIRCRELRARGAAGNSEAMDLIVKMTQAGATDRIIANDISDKFGLELGEKDITTGRHLDIFPPKAPEDVRRNNLIGLRGYQSTPEATTNRLRASQTAAKNAQPRVYTDTISRQIEELLAQHYTFEQVSERLAEVGINISPENLRGAAHRRGWKSTSYQAPERQTVRDEVIRLYEQGCAPSQIASELGISPQDVDYRLRNVGKKFRVKWNTEVRVNEGRRVTLGDVAEDLGIEGLETIRQVAQDAGIEAPITENTIDCLLRRRRKNT